jgi:hypothetical protein
VINSVSGGDVDVDDMNLDLPIDTTEPHIFEVPLRSGFDFRVQLLKTGGDATSKCVMTGTLVDVR